MVLSVLMLISNIDISVFAAEKTNQSVNLETNLNSEQNLSDVSKQVKSKVSEEVKSIKLNSNENITRVEWLTELTTLFEMSVEDGHYPDNYFSDLSADSEYYYNMLLAV